jgi:choline dehydrogenase-like flavoprotein
VVGATSEGDGVTGRTAGDELYDVIVVGAGIAGATVAKTVAEAGGKRVLVLEAGRSTGMSADKYQSHVEAFQATLAKVPNSPYPNNPNAPQADVLDLQQLMPPPAPNQAPGSVVGTSGYLVQTGPLPFASDYVRALGGTTLHWLGTSLRMLPNDFKLQSEYGQGLDWPVGYSDLKRYYERAEWDIIGVAGSVPDQHYPGIDHTYFGDYVYPMQRIPPSYLDQVMSRKLDGRTITVQGHDYEVQLSNTPAGRNSVPNPGYQVVGAVGNPAQGQRCEGNNNCIPICPVQAKYNALKTLYEVMVRHPESQAPTSTRSSVQIVTQAVVTGLTLGENGRVNGVTYKLYDDESSPAFETHSARAKVYVLAAHAIENAKLLLASGVGNSSGMVGRNLMDHTLILTWGLMPEKVWGYRGPLSTSGIEPFRDGAFRKRHCAFRIEVGNEAWNFSANAPYSTIATMVNGKEGLFGRRLRKKVGEVLPRQFRLALEMEQIPQASNYVTIDPAYRDRLGNYRPVIRYDLPDYVRAGMAAATEASDRMYELLGVPKLRPDQDPDTFPYPADYTQYNPSDVGYLTYGGAGYTYFGAGHVAGTHIMGSSRASSVVDTRQRSWDHDNLYLVGCGNMPTIGTSNPTLTMTAMAIWAGENILDDLGTHS